MYTNVMDAVYFFNSHKWSPGARTLMGIFFPKLVVGQDSIVGRFLGMISDVLPIALSVAGAILVVKLGWRLFRNFTRG